MLLVHGLGANTISWQPVGQPLADSIGAPVIAIDLAGFGYTRSTDTRATITRNADLVTSALETYGASIVVGNSMGGAIAVHVAARRPDLVEALVLVNPAVRAAGWWSPQLRSGMFLAPILVPAFGQWLVAHRALVSGPERIVDGALDLVLTDADALDPELRDAFVEVTRDRMRFPESAQAYVDAASSLFWYMNRHLDRDLATALETRPGLLVFGDRDRLIHVTSATALSRRHPDLAVAMLEGLGHAPQLEAPEHVVDVVSGWLDSLAERPASDPAAR